MVENDSLVFVVDDDPSIRQTLTWLIESVGMRVETFSSADAFLKRERHYGPACLILDVRMPGLSGIDLQNQLTAAGHSIPIIFITGHGTIPMSVRAMKAGAVDFIEKPFEDQTLLDSINRSLKEDRQAKHDMTEKMDIQQRLDSLTPREDEVFKLVVAGLLNKQIAHELGITERTVKAHRACVMKKIRAASLADLIRIAEKANRQSPQ